MGCALELLPGKGLDAGLAVFDVHLVEFFCCVLFHGRLDVVDALPVVGHASVVCGQAEHFQRLIGIQRAVDVVILAGVSGAVQIGR